MTGIFMNHMAIAELAGPTGQQEFTTAGTFSWTAPEGVTRVSVVCVGGGAGGGIGKPAGGGGGLGWKNRIRVIPGNTYTVVVGAGGTNLGQGGSPYQQRDGLDGGDSYFISPTTVKGGGGKAVNGTGGTYVGQGGGNGGQGGGNDFNYGGGGGGAGGYSGNGGKGSTWTYDNNSYPGTGGGGGGGYYKGQFDSNGGGGGVGILGEGSSGLGGPYNSVPSGGYGGSGGADGGYKDGGAYGGGGSSGNGFNTVSGVGARGAVRIIWGSGRKIPSTNTTDIV